MPDIAELYAAMASKQPPEDLAQAIRRSNAGLMSFAPPLNGPAPRYSDKRLNVGGYTLTEGPMKGQIVVANPTKVPRENVLGHESYHARVMDGGMPKTPNTLVDPYRTIASRMQEVQPPADEAGPYWGLRASSTPEEQMANLVGYEASLPSGSSIMDTDVGKRLFREPDTRNYYYSRSALPHEAVYEGMGEPNFVDKISERLRAFLASRGLNTVNR